MKRYFVDFAMGFAWVILDATLSNGGIRKGSPLEIIE